MINKTFNKCYYTNALLSYVDLLEGRIFFVMEEHCTNTPLSYSAIWAPQGYGVTAHTFSDLSAYDWPGHPPTPTLNVENQFLQLGD